MAAAREKFPPTTHTILKSALGAARPEDRPTPPWHLGGAARPVCPARGQIAIALALADRFADQVPPASRRQFDQVLAAVRSYLAGKDRGAHLRALSELDARKTPALGIACNAAGAAATLARGKADLVHTGVQAAAAKAVSLTKPGAATRELLAALDQEILCLECEAAFAAEDHPTSVERLLWRGVDARGKTVHFIARLEGGRVGGLLKLTKGKRALWAEGTAEEVLASVPEALFPSAVDQVLREVQQPATRLLR